MTSRRRMMLASGPRFKPDAAIPDAWKAVETISDSWEEIIYHAQKKGDYKTRYKLGDTKVANFGDEGLTLMHLVGFDCDELADGSGYAHMTWCPRHCLKTLRQWNSSHKLGYDTSTLNQYLQEVIFKLPKVLQDSIVEVKKTFRESGGSSDKATNSKIWIPSTREYFGPNQSWYELSGPIYSDAPWLCVTSDSAPDAKPGTSAVDTYTIQQSWTRTALMSMGLHVYCIAGTAGEMANCTDTRGVLPCFCI